jgi:hypothetical protein
MNKLKNKIENNNVNFKQTEKDIIKGNTDKGPEDYASSSCSSSSDEEASLKNKEKKT